MFSGFGHFSSSLNLAATANGGAGVLRRQALALKNDPEGNGKYVSGLQEIRVRTREVGYSCEGFSSRQSGSASSLQVGPTSASSLRNIGQQRVEPKPRHLHCQDCKSSQRRTERRLSGV